MRPLLLPLMGKFDEHSLEKIINIYPHIIFLLKEQRINFSATFPMHNRYFSNGDKPLVALVKKNGYAKLNYQNKEFILKDGEFVFFDDNEPHSWVMEACDLDIFYYKQTCEIKNMMTKGDYCLDSFF